MPITVTAIMEIDNLNDELSISIIAVIVIDMFGAP
jgi:hypothetical protein